MSAEAQAAEVAERRLWSVTELIKLAIPAPGLVGWAARVTAEYAVLKRAAWLAMADADEEGAVAYVKEARWRETKRAQDRGNALHRHAQALALGAPPPAPQRGSEAHVVQFERFLAEHRPVYLASEAPVYNLTHGYAGTLDAIVEMGGQVCVLDYKTTDKGPDAKSRPPYDEVALQLAAYARAEWLGLRGTAEIAEADRSRRYYTWRAEMDLQPMPEVTGALALMVSPVDYALHPVRIDDTVWRTFRHAQYIAQWSHEVARTAVGKPLAPSVAVPDAEQQVLVEAARMVAKGELVEAEDDMSFGEWVEQLREQAAETGGQAR